MRKHKNIEGSVHKLLRFLRLLGLEFSKAIFGSLFYKKSPIFFLKNHKIISFRISWGRRENQKPLHLLWCGSCDARNGRA